MVLQPPPTPSALKGFSDGVNKGVMFDFSSLGSEEMTEEKRIKAERTFDLSKFLENQNKQEETNIETDDPNIKELINQASEVSPKEENESVEEKTTVIESAEPPEKDQKEDNMLSNLGLSRDDLDDSGDMLEELKEIVGFYDD